VLLLLLLLLPLLPLLFGAPVPATHPFPAYPKKGLSLSQHFLPLFPFI
jgi:hypothetical protein